MTNAKDATAEPTILALTALAWTLSDDMRAQRLLDLTGLDAETLRGGAMQPALQAAVLTFLESHEPDLIACAEALDTTPEQLVAARRVLEA